MKSTTYLKIICWLFLLQLLCPIFSHNLYNELNKEFLIKNCGFEVDLDIDNLPDGWKMWVRPGAEDQIRYKLDGSIFHSGLKALFIQSQSERDWSIYFDKEFDISENEPMKYIIGGYIKCEDVENYAGLRLNVIDQQGQVQWYFGKALSQATHDWKYFSDTFVLPENAKKLKFDLIGSGKGKIWFDDVKFYRVSFKDSEKLYIDGKCFYDITDKPETSSKNHLLKHLNNGYLYFIPDDYDNILPYTIPTSNEIEKPIEVIAAKGEYEPTSFCIYASVDLDSVTIIINDLISCDGNRISKQDIDIRVVRCWPQRVSWNSNTYRLIPELLEKKEAVNIKANTTKQFWLTVKVPVNAKEGKYYSRIVIALDGEEETEIDLVLRVLPFRLEIPEGIIWGLYADSDRWKNYAIKRIESELQDIKEHGINSLIINPVTLGECSYQNGKLKIDLSKLNECMLLYKEMGFKEPIIFSVQTLSGSLVKRLLGYNSAEFTTNFKSLYIEIIKTIEKKALEKNWPSRVYHAIDEVGRRSSESEKERAKIELKILHNLGLKTLTTIVDEEFFKNNLDNLVDVRCYSKSLALNNAEELKKQIEGSNDIFWWYGSGCYLGLEGNTIENRFLTGVAFWKSGATGQWSWTFQRPKDDPYNDFDGNNYSEAKDACIVYPAMKGMHNIPTLQWEGIREGIDDVKYIYTLQQYIQIARRSSKAVVQEMAEDINRDLEDMLDGITKGKFPWIYGGVYDNTKAEEMRKQLTKQIIKLKTGI